MLKAEKKSDGKHAPIGYIDVHSKDGRGFRFKFSTRELDRILHALQSNTSFERKEEHFAFEFFKHKRELEEKYAGWKIHNIFDEFKRQGIPVESAKQESTGEKVPDTEQHVVSMTTLD